MTLIIVLFSIWAAVIIALIVSGVRSKPFREQNSAIYQKEHEKRLESFYKFNVETEEEALINWAEGEETVLTWKDLDDLDDIDRYHESHMNF